VLVGEAGSEDDEAGLSEGEDEGDLSDGDQGGDAEEELAEGTAELKESESQDESESRSESEGDAEPGLDPDGSEGDAQEDASGHDSGAEDAGHGHDQQKAPPAGRKALLSAVVVKATEVKPSAKPLPGGLLVGAPGPGAATVLEPLDLPYTIPLPQTYEVWLD
jgi:hypothetical protein